MYLLIPEANSFTDIAPIDAHFGLVNLCLLQQILRVIFL
jgi:hypothetical protein